MSDEPKFFCEICKKEFRKRTLNHLKVHGMSSWEEYEAFLSGRREAAPRDLISKVAEKILLGQEIPKEYLDSLSAVQKVVAARANNLLNIATMKRISRLGRLLDAMDPIDSRLTDPEEISKLDFPTLLKLSDHIRLHAKEIYDELSPQAERTSRAGVEVNIHQDPRSVYLSPGPGSVAVPADPRERADLMSQVKKLLAAASDMESDGKVVDV